MIASAAGAIPGVDRTDRLIGLGALAILAAALAALARGHGRWGALPLPLWFHLGGALAALALTPALLWRKRGDTGHRALGYGWVAAMALAALASFWVQELRPGRPSAIHLLSLFTLTQLPLVVLAARRHDVAAHRRVLRGLIVGALLIAGAFTFAFDRLLARWLLG